jgi:hypothetical protein
MRIDDVVAFLENTLNGADLVTEFGRFLRR